jgi:hypothetical protein
MAALKSIVAKGEGTWEVSGELLDSPIHDDKTKRPYFAANVMCVDPESGMIVHHDITPTDSTRRPEVEALAEAMLHISIIPSIIHIADPELDIACSRLCETLGIELRFVDEMPATEFVTSELSSFLQGRRRKR